MISMRKEASQEALPLLICTASRWEAGPLAARLGLTAETPGFYRGESHGRGLRLLKTGMGPHAAGRALAGLSKTDRYYCALSVGFAGALEPGLKSGDLVADLPMVPETGRPGTSSLDWPARALETAERRGLTIHFGRIAHADEVVADPRAKSLLGWREGARAVDMETKALRQWVGGRMPVLAVRVILDTVDEPLPDALPKGENLGAVLRYAAGNLRGLARLACFGWAQKRAIARLGLFLDGFLKAL